MISNVSDITSNPFIILSIHPTLIFIILVSIVEILERNQTQFDTSLRNMKDQHENFISPKDCNLRTGDSFRLRSVKFPEYEMGVTSVKLKDEFCYVGLRKVCISFI